MANQASRQAVAAYLRHKVREAVAAGSARGFGDKAGLSHPTILDIKSGVNALSKVDTIDKLAAALDLSSTNRLNDEAAKFADERPDLVLAEGSTGTRVELDTVTSPTFGDLPGWKEAAAMLPAWIPKEAIEGAARLGGAEFRERGRVTPDFVRRAVDTWLAGQTLKDDRSGEE